MARLWFVLLACTVTLTAVAPVRAQVKVSARVDRQEVTTDEQVELIVSVSGQGRGEARPSLPALPDFTVVSSSTSHSVQIVGGQVSSSVEYGYRLQPKRTGTLTIGPVTVHSGGQTYQTEPITITVTEGAGRAPQAPSIPPLPSPFAGEEPPGPEQAGEDVFARASVDKKRVYVNQQVTYTFSLYRAVNLWEAPHYEAPSTAGFWQEELPETKPTEEIIGGRRYVVERIRTALFPTSAGRQSIGPAKLAYRAGLFESARTVRTEPISVEVLPLPEAGRPQGFTGAVGSWKVALTVKPRQVAVGDAVTALVTLTGEGNVQTVSRPHLATPQAFKQYEPSVKRTTARADTTVRGTATFEHLLVPQQPGRFLIGPASLSYFDPEAARYRTTEAAAISVVVTPRGGTGVGGSTPSIPGTAPAADIQDIKPAPAGPAVPLGAPFLLLNVVPLALVVGAALYGRHQRRLLADPAYARITTAWRRAGGRLRSARGHRADGDGKAFYRCLQEAVSGYIADRLNLSPTVLGPEAARERLLKAGAGREVARQAEECLRACELGRFGSSSGREADMDSALAQAREVLRRLSRERIGRE